MQGNSSLKPVRRDRVRDQVFEQLKEQVVNGTWQPGSKLPSENDLAGTLGVSRVSIREALQKLATLGLLETRHGEGTFVREISADLYLGALFPQLVLEKTSIFEVLEYRRVMDTGAVSLAVERATAEDIEDMERILNHMQESYEDYKEFAQADLAFHLAVAKATKNPIFVKVNSIIIDILSVSMEGIVRALGRKDGLFYHKRILDAVKARDTEAAERIMREHVVRTVERLKEKGFEPK